MSRKGLHIIRHMMPEMKHNPCLRLEVSICGFWTSWGDSRSDTIAQSEVWQPVAYDLVGRERAYSFSLNYLRGSPP